VRWLAGLADGGKREGAAADFSGEISCAEGAGGVARQILVHIAAAINIEGLGNEGFEGLDNVDNASDYGERLKGGD
jgi:hypothetical protein